MNNEASMSISKRKNTYKSQQIRKKIKGIRNKYRKYDNIRRELVERTHGKQASNLYHARKPTYNKKDFDRIHEDEKGEHWSICSSWNRFSPYPHHPDIGWLFDWGNTGNYAPNLYRINAECIRSYFIQFQSIKKASKWYYYSVFEEKYKPKYKQYLYNIPKQMQFGYNTSRFKPMLNHYLRYILTRKCIDINCNKHTLFCHLKDAIFHVDQHKKFDELLNFYVEDRYKCFHCDECRKYKTKIDHFIWDFFCNDFECIIEEIKKNIKYEQEKDLLCIHEFNNKYSKRNCSKYLQDIIDINGISDNICNVILEYISHEYPIIDNEKWAYNQQKTLFDTICRYNCLHMSINDFEIKWIDDAYDDCDNVSNSELVYNKRFCVLSESYFIDEDKINFCIMGQIGYDIKDRCVYFCYRKDRKECHNIVFATKWLRLWNYIENVSIKINCYAFLFENNDECYRKQKNTLLTPRKSLKFTHWNCYYDSLYYSSSEYADYAT